MSSEKRIPLKSWFTTKKKLISEIENLKKQLEESKNNYELLEKNYEKWRKKSDIMDLLGDEELCRRLPDYGTLESIFKRLDDYETLQTSYKLLEKKNKKLLSESTKKED